MFLRKNIHWIILVMIFLLQAGFVRCYLPGSRWFTPDPIYTDDYIFHYADALEKTEYLREHGMLFSYNPYMRAGTPCNLFFSVDNNGWALLVYLLSFLPSGLVFKLYFLGALLFIPLILYLSARNFALERTQCILCTALGTLFLQVSVCVDFLYWGSVSYIFSCYFSLLVVSFLYAYVRGRRYRDIILFTLLFSAGLWVHIFTVIHVGIPLVFCFALTFRRLSWKHRALIIAALAVTFLANALWIIPYMVMLPDFIVSITKHFFYSTASLAEPLNTYFFFNIKFNEYMNIPFPKSGFVDLLLLVCAVVGTVSWRKEERKILLWLFACSGAALFLLAYYGSFWTVTASLTPLRFVIYMNVLLCFPAAGGMLKIYRLFIADRQPAVKLVTCAVLVYLLATVLATPYNHLFIKKDFRLITDVPAPLVELSEWIKENTKPDGRILVENSDFESSHQYYGTHFPYLLPLLTGREYIGNYSFYATSPDSFSSFACGFLFRTPISEYTPDTAAPYLSLYNVKWVVAWSKKSRLFFASAPKYFTFRKQIDKFYIFETNRAGNFFIKGSGTITAEPNRIELQDLKPEDGEVVISYHWMKYLKAAPDITVDKTLLLRDPVGFITLHDPPERVEIVTDYRAVFFDVLRILELFKRS